MQWCTSSTSFHKRNIENGGPKIDCLKNKHLQCIALFIICVCFWKFPFGQGLSKGSTGFDQPSPICGISYARSEYYRDRFCGSLVLAHLPKSSFRSCTQAKLIRTEVALAMRTALSVIKSLVSSPDKIVLIVRR